MKWAIAFTPHTCNERIWEEQKTGFSTYKKLLTSSDVISHLVVSSQLFWKISHLNNFQECQYLGMTTCSVFYIHLVAWVIVKMSSLNQKRAIIYTMLHVLSYWLLACFQASDHVSGHQLILLAKYMYWPLIQREKSLTWKFSDEPSFTCQRSTRCLIYSTHHWHQGLTTWTKANVV